MPLNVQGKEGLAHISVDETTKQRTDLNLSFRKPFPSSLFVYFSSVLAVKVDTTHAPARITETGLKKQVDRKEK